MNEPLELVVILGTARDGNYTSRLIPTVTDFAADRNWKVTTIEVGDHLQEHTGSGGDADSLRTRLEQADAFVIVTPEYNHSFPATIKNALDVVSREWAHKPLGYVSSGGISGGTRAVAVLEPVAAVLQLRAVPQAVHLPFPHQHLDDHGVLQAPEPSVVGARAMLDELQAMVDVLAHRRSA